MSTKISIDQLNTNSVSIKKETTVEVDGVTQELKPWRKAYVNSVDGRELLIGEVSEPYLSAILSIWGDTPTVSDEVL